MEFILWYSTHGRHHEIFQGGAWLSDKRFFHFFAQQAKNGNFCVFRTKLGAFRTNKMKKIIDFLRADYKKGENFVIFRRFRLNLGVFHASAKGASEKFSVFYRGTAYDVIIFEFQGGVIRPPAPPCGRP